MITKRSRRATVGRQKGFTLLEILVVLAILAILLLIVVPNFGKFFGSGQEEVCQMEERLVKSAVMAYASINEVCPTSIEDLQLYLVDLDDIQGTYIFETSYPDCSVTQESCP